MSRILVVDDEATVRNVLTTFLKRKGYEVAEAESGPSALEKFECFQPDLVLLDIWMPEMNGIEVLKALRMRHQNAAVIMVTSVDDETTAHEAITLGAINYITKPFTFEQLDMHLTVHLMFLSEN